MEWKTIKIADICTPKQWKNLPSRNLVKKGYHVYGANGIIGYHTDYTHEFPTLAITCRGATSGNIHLTLPKSYINSNAMALDGIDATKYSLKFLFYALKNRGLRDVISGSAQPQITRTNLNKVKLDIPKSLIDQIRIATLFSQIETLIQKRKESVDLLDDLVKSTFLEMFGDPVKNEKNWIVKPISKAVIEINSGTSYGGEYKERLESDELGVLKISAVTKGTFDPKQFKAVKKDRIKKKVLSVKKGMFLLSRANTIDLVAACCIVNQDYPNLFLPDKLWNLSIDEKEIEPIYLNYLLKNVNYRKLIAKKANGGHDSMLNISMKKFRTLRIPLPPKKIQTRFAQFVKKIESIKNKYETSLIELENLYGSLNQRAFRGELDLSKMKVDIPKEKLIIKTVVENLKEAGEKIQQAITTPLQELRKLEVAFRKGIEPFLKAQENLTKAILPITEKLKTQQAQRQATIQKVVQVLKQGVTFEHIWETEGIEDYEEIKAQLEEWISGEEPFMLQTFDEAEQKLIFKIR